MFVLAEDALAVRPKQEWPELFENWQQGFGYQVRFTLLEDELSYSASNKETLQQGGTIYIEEPVIRYAKTLLDSDWIMELSLEAQEDEEFRRSVKGARLLTEQILAALPEEKWADKVHEINSESQLDITLLKWNPLMFSSEQKQHLSEGQVVWLFNEAGDEQTFYWRLFESESMIAIGPIQEDRFSLGVFSSFFSVFFLLVASAIFIWLYPLWRRLKRLDAAAVAFGQGKLNQRVKVKRYSITSRLGHSFNQMAERIQTLVQTNQELTNAIAHDLRTPLAKIRFAIEMIDASDSSEEQKLHYKKSVNKSIDSLDYLLNQILIYSRYNRIADTSYFSSNRLADLIQDEVEEQQFLHEHLTLQCNIAAELQDKKIVLDKFALARALSNLLTNAAKFAQQTVCVTFTKDDSYYYLVVEDDGVGIAEDKLDTIFEPFKQIDNDERSDSEGHGLGLAIVKQIAKWHQGEVKAERSTALGGARFILKWPVSNSHTFLKKQ